MRRSPVGIALSVASFAAIVAVFLVPKPLQLLVLLFALALIVANVINQLLGFRDERIAAQAVVAAHPGATILRTDLQVFDGASRSERARVLAVLANAGGLSFRDRADTEVVRIAAASILSIELAPAGGRTPLRPAVVTRADGSPVRFTVGANDDQRAEAVVALRAALRR